tara:strand:- start:1001 stop:1657 length:657 start_codon:yes stop_codon:yes gene_type:complete
MLYPTIIADNFFTNPEKIRDFGLTLKKEKDVEDRYPGVRSKSLHEIDMGIFNYVGKKILSVVYPYEYDKLRFHATMYFQEVDSIFEEGWTHRDVKMSMTSIIYLSEHRNCGTSICEAKEITAYPLHTSKKRKYYNDPIKNPYTKERKQNNNQFENSIIIDSRYNRMLCFDSHHLHKANGFIDNKRKDKRLTLITFFYDINYNGERKMRYPLNETRQQD